MSTNDEPHELPVAPLGFLRHRSGSFDASTDGPLVASVPSPANIDIVQGAAAHDAVLNNKTVSRMPQQPAEIEEGCIEYKLLLAPESAGEFLLCC